ncbi:MAG: CBS domain-containing protein [Chloroflexi bacterium]|nr:CBS domain-containing protein [Chloroflexota bacterium]
MRLSDIMTRDPSVVRPDSTVSEAATMMRRLNVGSLPVCDGVQLQGMVTDRDITVRAIADGRDPTTTRVWDVMSHDVAWASEDVAVEEAAQIMREHQIRRLPVVDRNQNLVGIVSLGDLAVDVGEDPMSGATLEAISEPSRPDR